MTKFFRALLRGITDIPFVLILIVVMMMTIIGVPLPSQFPVLTAGDFQVASFPTGIAFYQEGNNSVFYSLSPINDYLTDTNGQKSTLTTYDAATDTQNIAFNQPTLWQKPVIFWRQFTNNSVVRYVPVKTAVGVSYKAEKQGNVVDITRLIRLPSDRTVISTTQTLKLTKDDIVISSNGQTYSATAKVYLDTLSPLLGIPLTPIQIASTSSQIVVPVPEQTIYIFNPNLAGMLAIKAENTQQIAYDRENSLLFITEPIKPNLTLIETHLRVEPLLRYPKL